jgi:hypothetical protein
MIDTTNRAKIIERELSDETTDPATRTFLTERYSGYAQLLRLRADRQEAEATFRTAHAAWDALNGTLRHPGQDGRIRDLQGAGVDVLAPWRFDGTDSPAELRAGAEAFDRLAKAAGRR